MLRVCTNGCWWLISLPRPSASIKGDACFGHRSLKVPQKGRKVKLRKHESLLNYSLARWWVTCLRVGAEKFLGFEGLRRISWAAINHPCWVVFRHCTGKASCVHLSSSYSEFQVFINYVCIHSASLMFIKKQIDWEEKWLVVSLFVCCFFLHRNGLVKFKRALLFCLDLVSDGNRSRIRAKWVLERGVVPGDEL